MPKLSELGKHVLQNYLLTDAFVWRLPEGTAAALTFDDGPHEEHTPRVLDLLKAHHVKATFFVVGDAVQKAPAILRRIVDEGHAVGSHTFTHRELPTLNRDELRQELASCRELIKQLTGVDATLIRPPRGRVDAVALMRIKRWGYRLIHWSKTYSDYRKDGREPLLRRIRAGGLNERDIALFHDNNAFTVEALAEMLPEWLNCGHSFATLR
jgi:peptidoglycan/xylan/chitin deacetylase (PgdA/CDA1 family)